jgi:hypothetical protein
MPLQVIKPPSGRRRLIFGFTDFTGGVNLASWPSEIPGNQFPASINLTTDGTLGSGLVSRFGSKDTSAVTGSSGQAYIIGWSRALNIALVQRGTNLSKVNLTTLAVTSIGTFTTSALAQAVEFGLEMVYCHPADGVFTYDGTTATNRSTTVKGSCLASWQNIVWVGGDTATNTRIWKSNIGDAHTWTTATDFIDIRDVNTDQVTAIHVGQGMDIQGRPGLMVAKGSSLYRINTPSTGAFSAISPSVGTPSAFGMTSLGQYLYVHGGAGSPGGSFPAGIWRTDGISTPQLVSGAIQPLFARGSLTNAWVVALRGRLFCSVPDPAGGSGFIGEYDPLGQAWFLHKLPKGLVAPAAVPGLSGLLGTYSSTTGRLGVFFDNGAAGSTYLVGTDGNDDGDSVHNAIVSTLQTRWVEPFTGRRVKTQRANVRARGAAISFGQRADYSVTQVADRTLALPFSSSTVKDTTTMVPLGSYGPARAVSYDLTASTSTLGSAQAYDNALGSGSTAVSVGAWAIEEILVDFTILGL